LNSTTDLRYPLLSLSQIKLSVFSFESRAEWQDKINLLRRHFMYRIIYEKFLKQVSQLCGFPLLSNNSISTLLLAVCFLHFYPKPAFASPNQPSVALHSL
jgi:hypothetical protein